MEGYVVVAEGLGTDMQAAVEAESRLKDGDLVELRLYVDKAPTPAELAGMTTELLAQGVTLSEPLAYDSGVLVLRYAKAPTPATGEIGFAFAIVAPIVLTVIGGIFAWQMARQSSTILANPLLIFAAVALVIVYFMMKTPDKDKEVQQ
jgi:hypothetical protein